MSISVTTPPEPSVDQKASEAAALSRVAAPTNTVDVPPASGNQAPPASPTPDAPKTPEVTPSAVENKPAVDSSKEVLEVVDAFRTNGKLEQAHLDTLKKFGLNERMVQSFVEGEAAKQELAEIKFLEPYGGKKEFEKVSEWAVKNMPEADLDTFNKVMEGGDQNAMKMAMDSLFDKFKRSNAPNPLKGYPSDTTASPYKTMSELRADMAKPEYASDPSFRRQVEERVRVSKF